MIDAAGQTFVIDKEIESQIESILLNGGKKVKEITWDAIAVCDFALHWRDSCFNK